LRARSSLLGSSIPPGEISLGEGKAAILPPVPERKLNFLSGKKEHPLHLVAARKDSAMGRGKGPCKRKSRILGGRIQPEKKIILAYLPKSPPPSQKRKCVGERDRVRRGTCGEEKVF